MCKQVKKIIGAIFGLAVISAASHASATGTFNATCTDLDAGQGGASYNRNTSDAAYVNAVAGDIFTVTDVNGTVNYFDGASRDFNTPSPATITVTAANAGQFLFQRVSIPSVPPPYAGVINLNLQLNVVQNLGAYGTISCAVNGGASQEDDPANLSPLVINTQGSALGSAISQAVGGSLNGNGAGNENGDQSGFTMRAYGLSSLTETSQTVTDPTVSKIDKQRYGSNLSFGYAPGSDSPWNIWFSGRFDFFNGNADGHVATAVSGANYLVNENALVGIHVGYGSSDLDANTSKLQSDGFTIGAHFGARLAPRVKIDGFASYTGSNYDIAFGTTTGKFDADRISAGMNLYGHIPMETYTLQTEFSALISSEDQESYTDSAAAFHASQNFTVGRISVGPKILFNPIETASGSLSPWIAAKFEYDFSNNSAGSGSTLPDLGDVSSGRLSAGFSAIMGSSRLDVSGEVGGIGSSEFTNYSGIAKITIPLN
ncbi:MAG: hypothetical protein COC23_04310 [Hyphomicrobiales bacterium]|nr:MAG: hypothetical protein COC23_04310 [Hyphomicrobiales bacterium]